MQKKLLIVLLITFSINAFSQKSLIDERNGFKTIKLGSSKSSFSNLSLFQELDDLTAYQYRPNDRDLLNVFDQNYDAIILYFDNSSKLVMIMITKVFKGNNFYQNAMDNSMSAMKKFTKVFGKADDMSNDDNSGNSSLTWYGKKGFIEVGTIYFGIAKGKAESQVIFGKSQNLSSGF